jgi:hypothetical protein
MVRHQSGLAFRLLSISQQEQPSSMLRITVLESSARATTLRVQGRIAGPWVEELRITCKEHIGSSQAQLYLELEEVSFADDTAVAYLKQLQDQGVGFLRVSPFLTELFKTDF